MNSFDQSVQNFQGHPLKAGAVQVIQANLGLVCNLSCRHCHVESSPKRTEVMSWATMESLLRLADALPGTLIDLTGGAPELNPHFRKLVVALRGAGHPVQVRTNLAVFFARHGRSLPVTRDPRAYRPGDLVTWRLGGRLPHIGIVTDRISPDGKRPLIAHNIGRGPKLEDMLFVYPIAGHFRYMLDE